jgi:hypothetical protein
VTKVLALTVSLLIAVVAALALFVALRRMRGRGVRAEYTSPVFRDPTGCAGSSSNVSAPSVVCW